MVVSFYFVKFVAGELATKNSLDETDSISRFYPLSFFNFIL